MYPISLFLDSLDLSSLYLLIAMVIDIDRNLSPALITAQAMEAIAADSGNSALVKIPMQQKHVRSLNLATSVGIGVYEAMRQLDGPVLPDVDNF